MLLTLGWWWENLKWSWSCVRRESSTCTGFIFGQPLNLNFLGSLIGILLGLWLWLLQLSWMTSFLERGVGYKLFLLLSLHSLSHRVRGRYSHLYFVLVWLAIRCLCLRLPWVLSMWSRLLSRLLLLLLCMNALISCWFGLVKALKFEVDDLWTFRMIIELWVGFMLLTVMMITGNLYASFAGLM